MNALPLLAVKLRRPYIPHDFIPRTHLFELFDQLWLQQFILISAPAGYGKTTLVSAWLDTWKGPSAWLSLDKKDNDPNMFLTYFLAAIETVFPKAVQSTQALLKARTMPRPSVIVTTLIDELDDIDNEFVLVLDDLHFIHNTVIHNLLTEFLHYLPRSMRLVLLTRHDPPLPLAQLRARGKMAEIRSRDLRFTKVETALFLNRMLKTHLDDETVSWLEKQTEGWVTGLRLAVLFMRHKRGKEYIAASQSIHNRYILDYFVSEVLANQPAAMRICLLQTAILDRFCASLCEAVCASEAPTVPPGLIGQAFLEWLEQSSLFIEPMDDQCYWYRYHHLFQQLLQHQLEQQYTPEQIATLHYHASIWFMQQGLSEEAIYHALTGGHTKTAVQVITQHRYALMNEEQWNRLLNWVQLFPRDVVENTPELLIVEAWVAQNRFRFSALPNILGRIEALLAQMSTDDPQHTHIQSEIDVLRSVSSFWAGDIDSTFAYAHRALKSLPRECHSARILARLFVQAGYLDKGNRDAADSIIDEGMLEEPVYKIPAYIRMLTASCFMYWIIADQHRLVQATNTILVLGKKHLLPESIGWANYFLGSVQYLQNNLTVAEEQLSAVVQQRYAVHSRCFIQNAFSLAATYLATGRPAKAHQVIDLALTFSLEMENTFALPIIQAFQAHLALWQGDLSVASAWASQFTPPLDLRHITDFFAPHITLVKVLLAENTASSHQQATDWLLRLRDFLEVRHANCLLIDVLALQALLYDLQGQEQAMFPVLEKAVMLAHVPGYIRPFVDLGPRMDSLLAKLSQRGIAIDFIARIRAAFHSDNVLTQAICCGSSIQPDLHNHPTTVLYQREVAGSTLSPDRDELLTNRDLMIESLTNREMDVLLLMEQRLTNKEIAQALGISAETVKQHAISVFRKLHVNNRRQASVRARTLKILPLT